MRPASLFTIVALTGMTVARPSSLGPPLRYRRQAAAKCMTVEEMEFMVDIYRQQIAEYTEEIGEKYISKDFVDTSDSINTFIHLPLGGPTFPTKQVFLDVQYSNVHFPVEILSIDAHECNTVALQWKASFGEANLSSKGITIFETVWEEGLWKILRIDVEFNALTWLLNMGGSYTWEGETYTPESPDPAILPPPIKKVDGM